MKIERLIAIIILLLQNKKVTASMLAEKFNVSKRTIYRDITDITLAGIPILTAPGSDGGIRMDDDYKLDKTLFTEQELQAILTGLLSLDSIAEDKRYQQIMDKFLSDRHGIYAANKILIDLSSHYKDTLAPKISMIRSAIENSQSISFNYCSSAGERCVQLDPYLIVFQWSSWYVLGKDREKQAFHLFKLNRLWQLENMDQTFELQEIPSEKLAFNQFFTDEIHAVIHFDKRVKYRVIEEYGFDSLTELDENTLRFEFNFTNAEYLLTWVMSFGDDAELIEPIEYRNELLNRSANLLKKYSQ